LVVLGHRITPEIVREVRQKASVVRWGTHLVRWRYFDVTHEGTTYHRGSLIPTGLWHLLKRIYVDRDWSAGTTLEKISEDARSTIEHPTVQVYVYEYYRTDPPRLQWGFLNPETGVAVIYDMEANLVATVFKPEEGEAFFLRQVGAVRIDLEEWGV